MGQLAPSQRRCLAHWQSMHIQTWQSFACNNSSSYHIVAKFSSPVLAGEVAGELAAFFEAHTSEQYHGALSLAMTELAIKHDFEWGTANLDWASDWESEHETLEVEADGDRVLIYHSYCLGEVEGIMPYMEARGGEEVGSGGEPALTAFVHFAEGAIGQTAKKELCDFFSSDSEQAPWGSKPAMGVQFWWCDDRLGGFCVSVDIENLNDMRNYLVSDRFKNHRLLLGDSELSHMLRTLSDSPNCPECGGVLALLEEDLSIPDNQAACHNCGGMFDLQSLAATSPVSRFGKATLSFACSTPTGALISNYVGSRWTLSTSGWSEQAQSNEGNSYYGKTGVVLKNGDILLCGYNGVCRSSDNGITSQPIPNTPNGMVQLVEAGNEVLYGFTDRYTNKVKISSDNALTWITLGMPKKLENKCIECILAGTLGNTDFYLCVAREGELLLSHDKSRQFMVLLRPTKRRVRAMIWTIPQDGVCALGVGDDGLILFTDDGAAWSERTCGTENIRAVLQTSTGQFYATTETGNLLSSADGFQTWKVRDLGTSEALVCLCETGLGTLIATGTNGIVVQIPLTV